MDAIRIQFRNTQNPFTLILSPLNIEDAEKDFAVEDFIDTSGEPGFLATSGIIYLLFIQCHSGVLRKYKYFLQFTFIYLGNDFSNTSYMVTVPATEGTNVASGTFTIPINFTIIDDDIDEIEQSFGPDVPDNFTCFQIKEGDIKCRGRKGATQIKIIDTDRKL